MHQPRSRFPARLLSPWSLLATAIVGLANAFAAPAAMAAQSSKCAFFFGYTPINLLGPSFPFQDPLEPGDVVTITVQDAQSPITMTLYQRGSWPPIPLIQLTSAGTKTFTVTQSDTYIVEVLGASATTSWDCTPGGLSVGRTAARHSASRAQAIVTNTMGSSRQIDRLMDQDGGVSGVAAPGTGFTADEKRALDVASNGATSSRGVLALAPGAGDNPSPMPLGAQLGLRAAYDDDLTSPMRTRGPGYGDDRRGGMTVAGLNVFGSDGAYNFSTSLRDVTHAAQQQETQRLKDDPTAATMAFTASRSAALDRRANPLDVWVEGRFLRLTDGRNGADLSGHAGLFGAGVDYVFSKSLLAGVSFSYDTSGQKSAAIGTEARGTGWLVGPYATVRLSDRVFWQSRASWGRAGTDVSSNLTTTDSFGSTRWLASSKLTGRFQMGAWQLRPSAGIAYMEEISDGYRRGADTTVDNMKIRVGTASAGPEIAYQYRLNPDTLIEPRISAEAIWTLAHDVSTGDTSGLVGSEAVGPGGRRGRIEVGLRTMIVGGTVVDFSGAYDGIGAGAYNAVTGRAVVRLPLN